MAYVPVGSIKKGEEIVTTGAGGKTVACAICHGADLKGIGEVPPIVGRSPEYIYRQLNDIKIGTRNGTWVPLMKPVVETSPTRTWCRFRLPGIQGAVVPGPHEIPLPRRVMAACARP